MLCYVMLCYVIKQNGPKAGFMLNTRTPICIGIYNSIVMKMRSERDANTARCSKKGAKNFRPAVDPLQTRTGDVLGAVPSAAV